MTLRARKSRTLSNGATARHFPPPGNGALRLSIPYAVPDPVFDRSVRIQGRDELRGRFKRLSDGVHFHVDMDGMLAGSHYECCLIDDGFLLVSADIYFDAPHSMFASFPDTLRIFVASSGDGESVSADGESLRLKAPNSAILIEPANCTDSNVTSTGHTKYVCIFLRREALEKLYGGREDELPAVLQAFVEGNLQQAIARAIPLTSGMLRCLEDVQACQLRGQRRRLYMQSKSVEIICQAFESFESEQGTTGLETTNLTASGVLKAQRLLAENFVSPPSLQDLAREVGMSRTALCTGFRQILGQSVFDYIEDLRMQQALILLNDNASTVTQIAHALGYNHSSSFSVAIHRRFGATPSELRRRAGSARMLGSATV